MCIATLLCVYSTSEPIHLNRTNAHYTRAHVHYMYVSTYTHIPTYSTSVRLDWAALESGSLEPPLPPPCTGGVHHTSCSSNTTCCGRADGKSADSQVGSVWLPPVVVVLALAVGVVFSNHRCHLHVGEADPTMRPADPHMLDILAAAPPPASIPGDWDAGW